MLRITCAVPVVSCRTYHTTGLLLETIRRFHHVVLKQVRVYVRNEGRRGYFQAFAAGHHLLGGHVRGPDNSNLRPPENLHNQKFRLESVPYRDSYDNVTRLFALIERVETRPSAQ